MATHPPTTPTRSTNGDARGPLSHPSTTATSPAVNRKKQKRRQKQAARLATEPSDELHAARDTANSAADDRRSSHDNAEIEDDIADISHPGATDMHKNGHSGGGSHNLGGPAMTHDPDGLLHATSQKAKKKKNKKGRSDSHTLADGSSTPLSTPSATFSHPPPPPSLPYASQFHAKSAREGSIWNQSSLEERENIRTFWFELGEEERRQLVKVEKDAVLKKMKEQQKHSCSCTVCGRKRTAIEEELEVLYDAYYEELEQYANNNQGSFDEGAPIIPPPRLYQPPLRSPGQHTRTHGQFHPSRGRVQELPEDDEEGLEDDYDEEEDDEEDEEDDELYSEEEFEDEEARAARADFFAFGNSLTVKDGILTVADDLLKNDGKHFIDMMEQLAERRMQREEDTQYNIAAAHQSFHAGHNHGPLDDEDYDDEEDEDYDSQEEEEEEFDEDEMDAMTEEQRMQEGRRMFQIFAARMFEQRVMTAYREKVAEQRQKQLIEELLEEENRNEQRNAKKAREAQKKKDKKRLQKQAKEEEKARRDAEKAAEEAAAKAAQEKKLEEQRLKREEQRKKREAERKAQEEERARKEAEKHRRLQEERERHAEAERKQREQKEEKKRREEAKRKEKEEREAQEKKNKEEQERRTREEQAKKDLQSVPTVDQEPKERGKHDAPARAGPGPIPLPSLQSQFPSGSLQSPLHAVATPVAPKVSTTPGRPRQPSHQSSHTSSPHSQTAPSDFSLQPSISPRSFGQSHAGASAIGGGRPGHQQPPLHHPQPSAPLSPLGRSNPPGFPSLGGLSSGPPGLPGMGGRPLHPELPMYSPNSGIMSPLRGFNGPAGIPAPPGINGVRPMGPGRGFPTEPAPGLPFATHHGVPGAFPMQQPGLSKTHSKQPSGSFQRSPLESGSQPFPISRPSPIKRPPSAAQDHHEVGHASSHREVDDLSTQLGSSALLDDTDGPYPSKLSQSLPGANAPGQFPPPSRASFQGSSLFTEPLGPKPGNFTSGSYGWGAPFGSSTLPGASSTWGATTANGSGWPNAFTAGSHHRGHTSRPVTIRLLVIQACKQLSSLSPRLGTGGYHEVNMVLGQVQQLRSSSEPAISLDEMLEICDTEGNHQNGGGSFSIKENGNGRYVKFEPDTNSAAAGHRGSIVPGDIGSPIPGSSHPATFGAFGAPSVLRQYASPPAGLYGGTS